MPCKKADWPSWADCFYEAIMPRLFLHIQTACDWCGKVIQRPPSLIHRHNFCGRECKRQYDIHYVPAHNRIPNDVMIASLQDATRSLGHSPRPREFDRASGHFASVAIRRRFGSWANALATAGLPPILTEYPAGDLVNELLRVHTLLDKTPTFNEFKRHGRYSTAAYWRVFGSWIKACVAAGLQPNLGLETAKFYTYDGPNGTCRLLGQYEVRFAIVLDKLGLRWMPHGKIPQLFYHANGELKKYTPDFYIPNWAVYVDVKDKLRSYDRRKLLAVRASNPDIALLIITSRLLHLYEQSVQQD